MTPSNQRRANRPWIVGPNGFSIFTDDVSSDYQLYIGRVAAFPHEAEAIVEIHNMMLTMIKNQGEIILQLRRDKRELQRSKSNAAYWAAERDAARR